MLNYGPAGKHRKITFYCSSKTRFIQSAKAGKGRREINTCSRPDCSGRGAQGSMRVPGHAVRPDATSIPHQSRSYTF